MILDSSALVAILLSEPAAGSLADALDRDAVRMIAAPTMLETTIVLEARRGRRGVTQLRHLLDELEALVVSFDEHLAEIAAKGWRKFGKGNHPAALNLGDCFTYALAKSLNEPVLCVGNDFARTDVTVVPLS